MTVNPSPAPAPVPPKKSGCKVPCIIIAVILLLVGGGIGTGLLLCGGGIFGIWKATEGPRVATREFIRGLADNDNALVEKHNGGFSEEQLKTFVDYIQKLGKFDDVTFSSTNINNNTATVEGTAKFASGSQTVKASLVNTGGEWKIGQFQMKPAP